MIEKAILAIQPELAQSSIINSFQRGEQAYGEANYNHPNSINRRGKQDIITTFNKSRFSEKASVPSIVGGKVVDPAFAYNKEFFLLNPISTSPKSDFSSRTWRRQIKRGLLSHLDWPLHPLLPLPQLEGGQTTTRREEPLPFA
ncbi:hypothetical protein Q3G72_020063 [Acer saccharum]|nr:hypothetical protein Q3G72_034273 [Acer saccharum]KAK1572941.1 hypothetical protein Q3G72_020063 [Acer saccharum]